MQAIRKGRSALARFGSFTSGLIDPLAEILLVPGVPVDRADHAEGIARGRQEDRDGAGLHQRALMQRLVIVAVEKHQVAALQRALVTTLFEVLVPFSTK